MNIKEAAWEVGCWLNTAVFPTREKRPVPALGRWGHFIGREFSGNDFESLPWSQADGYAVVIPDGVVVLDLDADEDGSLTTAKTSLARVGLYEAAKKAPYKVKTRSGGLHVYFDADGLDTSQFPDSLGPGAKVDIRRIGHYVIGPGSRGYRWVRIPGGAEERFIEPLPILPFLFAAG